MQGNIINVSGLGASVIQITIETEGGVQFVNAEGRLTVEALQDAFGSIEGSLGQAIDFEVDDIGMLAAFSPL
jgi:hypothetical protein